MKCVRTGAHERKINNKHGRRDAHLFWRETNDVLLLTFFFLGGKVKRGKAECARREGTFIQHYRPLQIVTKRHHLVVWSCLEEWCSLQESQSVYHRYQRTSISLLLLLSSVCYHHLVDNRWRMINCKLVHLLFFIPPRLYLCFSFLDSSIITTNHHHYHDHHDHHYDHHFTIISLALSPLPLLSPLSKMSPIHHCHYHRHHYYHFPISTTTTT